MSLTKGILVVLLVASVGIYLSLRSPVYSETKLAESYDFIIGTF